MAYPLKLPARPWYWWVTFPLAVALFIVVAVLAAVARLVLRVSTAVGERVIGWILSI